MSVPNTAQAADATRDSARWLGRLAIQVIRIAFALLLILLADRVVAGKVSTDEALAVAGLSLAALAALALTPAVVRDMVRRISKISVGPVALEVFEEVGRKATGKRTEDSDKAERRVQSVLALRLKIERKLTYIAKHVLDEDGHPTFLTVDSLKYDKLLSKKEADLVNQLMTLRDEDIAEFSTADRDNFLKGADTIAHNLRAGVLHCLVAKILRDPSDEDRERLAGWKTKRLRRKGAARCDFVAEKDGRKYRIASVFATDRKSQLLDTAKKRLSPGASGEGDYERRIIVLPHKSKSKIELDADPAVVTTDQLLDVLCGA